MRAKLIALCAVLAASLGMTTAASAQQFISVLTGGTSGVYYPLGVALSNIYAKDIPSAKSTVQATKASVENLNLLAADKGEIAFTLADSLADAWAGNAEAGFAKPLKSLRAVAAIYPNYIQIVASAASGIHTLADLKGKRLSVGAPKSGTELNARAVLKAAGLTYADLGRVEYLPFDESVELIKNRQLDATLQSAGLGVASIRDLAVSIDIVIVPVPPEVVARINNPAYQATVIPNGTYKGMNGDVPAIEIPNFLVTRADLPDDLVYEMTKAFYENLPDLIAAHSAAKSISLANGMNGAPIPFHPGAERYYREKGVLK